MECLIASGMLLVGQALFAAWVKWHSKAYMEEIFENAEPCITKAEIEAWIADYESVGHGMFKELSRGHQQLMLGEWVYGIYQGWKREG